MKGPWRPGIVSDAQCFRAGVLGTALIGLLAFTAVSATPASGQEVPDASCPGPSEVLNLAGDGEVRAAQTFVAQHTGTLTRASIAVNKIGTAGDWLVQILSTSAGKPAGGPLSSALVPDASVPGGLTTITTAFSAPATVSAGGQYALVLSRPGSDSYEMQHRTSDPCLGTAFFAPIPQPSEFTDIGGDLIFSVFVTLPSNPAPAVTPAVVAPVKKCKKGRKLRKGKCVRKKKKKKK